MSKPADEVWLDADGMRLSQVVGNLLNNASKFTPRAGVLALDVTRSAETLRIVVADNGKGISQEFLPAVFELFSQGEVSLDRASGGLGIGLSLVKGLVELHGGRVSAHSAGEGAGKGSSFVIELPLAGLEVGMPGPQASRTHGSTSTRRVLVVEDNLDAAEAMAMLLRELGHEVAVVNDGSQAVEVARVFRPDTILLDLGLPGVDGFELAQHFRTHPETSRAKVIAVTGYGQAADRARTKASGFDLHLVKPVDPDNLSRALGA